MVLVRLSHWPNGTYRDSKLAYFFAYRAACFAIPHRPPTLGNVPANDHSGHRSRVDLGRVRPLYPYPVPAAAAEDDADGSGRGETAVTDHAGSTLARLLTDHPEVQGIEMLGQTDMPDGTISYAMGVMLPGGRELLVEVQDL